MIKRFLLFLFISIILFSCEKAQDTKGETIPPLQDFAKSQNPTVIVSYLSNLLENQDGANLYYLRAKAYFDLRAYQKAEDDIEIALSKVPGDIDYLLLSAQVKSKLGLIDEAIEDAKLVESSGLASTKLYILLAELNLLKQDPRGLELYLLKTKQAGVPESEKVYYQFLTSQMSFDSLEVLGSTSGERLDHPDLSHAYFSYQIGRMADIQFQKQILAEIKKYPLDPYLLVSWGDFLVHINQFSQAEKVYNQVSKWLPHTPSVRIRMARFYLVQKKYEMAHQQLDKIPKTSYLFKDAIYLRALVRLNSGQREKCIALLDSVRKLNVNDGRFISLYDRLTSKRTDSLSHKVDSVQTITP